MEASESKQSIAEREAAAAQETHAQAARKEAQMARIGAAFGLRSGVVEGEAFDQELQAKRKEEKALAREAALRDKLAAQEAFERAAAKCAPPSCAALDLG